MLTASEGMRSMSKRAQTSCLLDIRGAIVAILEYTDGMSFDDLRNDRRTSEVAFARNQGLVSRYPMEKDRRDA